jgi:DNA-binding NarL/FixJ family response regulator
MADQMPHALGQLMVSQALAHWLAGRLEQSEAVAGNLYELAVIQRADDARGLWSFALGRCALARGQARSAVRWLRESADLLRQDDIGRFLPWSLSALAHALALLGDADAARAALTEASTAGVEAVNLFKVDLALGQAWLAATTGETSTARHLALNGADEAAAVGQRVAEVMALHDLARLGDPKEAAPRLAAVAPHVDGVLATTCAEHAAALAADDGPGLEAASAAFEDMGAYLLSAEAAAAAASAHRSSGRASRATLASGRAHALAAAHCDGVRTPALRSLSETSPVTSLTRREREVATLAASGLSNREIAAKLALSVRTVDNHLARSFVKLGANARSQLASVLGPAQQ